MCPNKLLFEVLSAAAIDGVRAKGDGLANKSVPLLQPNHMVSESTCLFICIHTKSPQLFPYSETLPTLNADINSMHVIIYLG